MRKYLAVAAAALVLTAGVIWLRVAQAPIAVDWTRTHQTVDGFGAATAGVNPLLTPDLIDFFYTDRGTHLKFIRVEMWPSVAACEEGLDPGECVITPEATIGKFDLANAKAAVARGAVVWATEWSPPGSMTSNGKMSGGSFLGGDANYKKLADLQASFVRLMTGTYGIPIYAISPQNEPDRSEEYSSCMWTPQQFHDFVPYLSKALSDAGYGSVKIMIAEASKWTGQYSATALADPAVAASVSIVAVHGYGPCCGEPPVAVNSARQQLWESEVADLGSYDGSMTSGLFYAKQIHSALTIANVNVWSYWSISGILFKDNEGLTDVDGHIAKRAYVLGNFSRFILPGWTRVDVANSGRLLVSAYKGLGDGAAIVVVNTGVTAFRQEFRVGSVMGQAVVPWITSDSLDLKPQPSRPVSNGSFTYTIPAKSVVTFATAPANHP